MIDISTCLLDAKKRVAKMKREKRLLAKPNVKLLASARC